MIMTMTNKEAKLGPSQIKFIDTLLIPHESGNIYIEAW